MTAVASDTPIIPSVFLRGCRTREYMRPPLVVVTRYPSVTGAIGAQRIRTVVVKARTAQGLALTHLEMRACGAPIGLASAGR